MRRRAPWIIILVLPAVTPLVHASEETPVRLSEIVADPQTDWTGDGRITASDEYVELHNAGTTDVDLAGWILRLADSTPADTALDGILVAGGRRVVQNPTGDTNNDGHALILDAHGRVRDEVRYGAWPEAQAPTANADGVLDESLRRLDAWTRGHATPASPNDALGWRLSSTLTPAGGWVAPNSSATFFATVFADATDPLIALELRQGGQPVLRIDDPGTRLLHANHTIVFADPDVTIEWRALRNASEETRGQSVRIDARAPVLSVLAPVVWHDGSQPSLRPASAYDEGIGGVEYQWRIDDGVREWSPDPDVPILSDAMRVQVRARDAFNNTTPWSDTFDVLCDAQPPRLQGFEAEPGGRLSWDASDNGSGLVGFELVRRAAHTILLSLGPEARNHTDELPAEARVSYELVAVDHAGRRSETSYANVTTDAARPMVRAIRFSKPVWSSGGLEVRIDFDRPMDAQIQPDVRFSPSAAIREARFLANRSTYYVSLAPFSFQAETELRVHVLNATSRDGQTLARPFAASLPIDAATPTLTASHTAGATNASLVTLSAHDTSSVRIHWKLLPASGTKAVAQGEDASPVHVDLPHDGAWRIKAIAVDAAGRRSDEVSLSILLDRAGPLIEVGNATLEGLIAVRLEDPASGVDWHAIGFSHPSWRASVDAARKRLLVQPAGPGLNATLTVQDLAGNQASVILRSAARDATTWDASVVPHPSEPSAPAPQQEGGPSWWPSALAFVGGVGAAIPIHRARVRRRRRTGSFARRLRTVLADTAPNDVVKDGGPG